MNIIKKTQSMHPVQIGVVGGVLEALYIFGLSRFFVLLEQSDKQPEQTQAMIMGLLLFVISAAISGMLVLGYPLFFAIQKEFRKALQTAGAAILTLIVLLVVMLTL